MSIHNGLIFDAQGHEVAVEIHDDLSVDTLLDIEDQWAPARSDLRSQLNAANVPREDWPQSLHWDWGRKSLRLVFGGDPDDYRIMGIRRQTTWEAAMESLCKGYSSSRPETAGQPLVYLDYIEVAPWNWNIKPIQQVAKYKAVGVTLLRLAAEQSYAKGWDGRVGLHALPQAAPFYEKHGFRLIKNDPTKQNLPYYELSAADAKQLTGRR